MTAQLPGVSLIGGFILLPNGQAAIQLSHVFLIEIRGWDGDTPEDKSARVVACLTQDEDNDYILGRFQTTKEASCALEDLLHVIERADVTAAEREARP